jgi:maltose alpha-D-glucosyltransferase/alpha-amylase
MQWNGDRNAGFSRADPQALYLPLVIDPVYHYQSVNVEAQRRSPSSLLNWMRRLIAIRKRYPVFGRGTIEFLHPTNLAVLAYLRRDENQTVLVVNNLSRWVQPVELDLHEYAGALPIELFGETAFPRIGAETPYFLSLGPHTFYWFRLETPPHNSV